MSNTQLKQKIIQRLDRMEEDKLVLLDSFIDSLDAELVESQNSIREISADEQRQVFVSSLKGKYAQAATSSDAFAQRKQEEIDREDRPK